MTIDGGCAEIGSALGVYVVGAIGPADRAVIEAHLGYPLSAPSAGSGVRGFVVTTASGKPLVSVPIR